jgi:HEAT repeat protein
MSAFAPAHELARRIASDLDRTEPELRELALDRLGVLAGDHVELIAGRLDDPDLDVRGSAAANLGRVRRATAWPLLLGASRAETSDEVQRHIVGALAPYRDDAILVRLLELLARRDDDYRVRIEVAVQLWKYAPEIAVPALVELVRDGGEDDIVRLHAAESLELLDELSPGDPARRALWQTLAEVGGGGAATVAERALARELVAPSPDVLAAVTRRLRHRAAEERSCALDRLSMLAPVGGVALARPLLDDEDPGVRVACCACLGALRDEAAVPLLLAALGTAPVPRVQVAALIGLEGYHMAEIGDALLDRLETGTCTPDALSILGRQLWKYPSDRTVELIRRRLASQDKLPDRRSVERALAFAEHFLSSGRA